MPFSFTRAALASLSILMMVACSSSETEDPTIVAGEEHPGGGIDPGTLHQPEPGTTIPYPAGPFGRDVGSIIRNYKFSGFANPSEAEYKATKDTIVTIRLSDYYNPDNDPNKPVALLLNASARWCTVCQKEAGDSKVHYPYWKEKRVEFITAIFEDDDGEPADFSDIEYWGARFKLEYPLVLDPKLTLGAFFDKSASPFNMIIDTRTMKIVFADEGLIDLGPKNATLVKLTSP
ncbi:MAG TPA: redoxin domain-containing protein [Polyangiaceae bacterium]|jgi:hypothetical protein|nr:MAG: AhpC/TSA family protein [Deltaproteobacteria bacterium ADurb.Bin207]HNS97936.1 redoxin domain-containing protein [Polyangiaceae bacterium]HNZ23535.1 redoxin domain-containing protein [Polyangiaceae bacterium]HOD24740.1 redoxin domain-containing protein [Polyangiaceae bacterium]HOE50751.1 redoxin domain-containing protein [Polyangiaceae bacterium]